MSVHLHWLTRRRIHRLFVRPEAAASCRGLMLELAACRACADLYSRYQTIEATLCGTAGTGMPTVHAIERFQAAVLDGMPKDNRPGAAKPSPRLLAGLAGAAAVAAVIVTVLLRTPASQEDHITMSAGSRLADVEIVARGGTPTTSEIGIRLFKVTENKGAPPPNQRVTEPTFLALDDVITFTYTVFRPGIRYAVIFGVQSDGAIRWYYPGYGGAASVPLRGDRVDEPLGDGIRLKVHHQEGWLRITAIFSAEPIPVAAVGRSLRALMAEHPDMLRNLEPLAIPGTEILQHSLVTHIVRVP